MSELGQGHPLGHGDQNPDLLTQSHILKSCSLALAMERTFLCIGTWDIAGCGVWPSAFI